MPFGFKTLPLNSSDKASPLLAGWLRSSSPLTLGFCRLMLRRKNSTACRCLQALNLNQRDFRGNGGRGYL